MRLSCMAHEVGITGFMSEGWRQVLIWSDWKITWDITIHGILKDSSHGTANRMLVDIDPTWYFRSAKCYLEYISTNMNQRHTHGEKTIWWRAVDVLKYIQGNTNLSHDVWLWIAWDGERNRCSKEVKSVKKEETPVSCLDLTKTCQIERRRVWSSKQVSVLATKPSCQVVEGRLAKVIFHWWLCELQPNISSNHLMTWRELSKESKVVAVHKVEESPQYWEEDLRLRGPLRCCTPNCHQIVCVDTYWQFQIDGVTVKLG